MRGIPQILQTRLDMTNLVGMAQRGELDKTEIAELEELIRSLLGKQYRTVPIILADRAVVTTRYFPEVKEGDVTADGLTVKSVSHTENPEQEESEGTQYSETVVTLSKAPNDRETLSIFNQDNWLKQNGFEIDEINFILGVLKNA